MDRSVFFKNLIGLGLAMAAFIFASSFIPVLKAHQLFSWATLLFFNFFTLIVFIWAERTAHSSNQHAFSAVILGVIFMKMVFIVLFVLVYSKAAKPENTWFLLPFFIIYLGFTIFEVYFMSKLGRVKPKKNEVQSSGQ